MRERYEAATGRDLSGINYYRAFSHWRLAAIGQGVYKRYLVGAMGANRDVNLDALEARCAAPGGCGARAHFGLDDVHFADERSASSTTRTRLNRPALSIPTDGPGRAMPTTRQGCVIICASLAMSMGDRAGS